jgi:HK97 gp10 family phage protein
MAGGIEARVNVPGLRQLVTTMRKAGIDMADLKEANRAAGTIVATRGKAVVPRGATGRLAASIRPSKTARKAVVRAGGSGIRYARFQEFGSSKNRAHHYLYGSAFQTQPQWVPEYERELSRIVARIKGE